MLKNKDPKQRINHFIQFIDKNKDISLAELEKLRDAYLATSSNSSSTTISALIGILSSLFVVYYTTLQLAKENNSFPLGLVNVMVFAGSTFLIFLVVRRAMSHLSKDYIEQVFSDFLEAKRYLEGRKWDSRIPR